MKTLVIAPHPDDELLGCGGTLLRRKSDGSTVGWLLMTSISRETGWDASRVAQRAGEIESVRNGLGISIDHFFCLNHPTAHLERIPLFELVSQVGGVIKEYKPDEILIPFPGDIHSDHRITFEAASACTKWFRYPTIKRVLAYETLSETNFGINPQGLGFNPTFFVDISEFLNDKLALMETYKSEIGSFPFPRSVQSLRALAELRGSQVGVDAAEAFVLLREHQ